MNVALYWIPFLYSWEISCLSRGNGFWGPVSEVIFRKAPLHRVGGVRSRWGTLTSLNLQSAWHPGQFSEYVDWQKPECILSATPPTHALYKMFHSTNKSFRLYESSKSEWSLLLREIRMGRGQQKNVSQWLGTCQDPACWSEPVPRVIGGRNRSSVVRSPFFPFAPSPSHGGTREAGSLSPPTSWKGGAGSARQAGFQEKQSSASGSPLLWTEIKDNYFSDKVDIPTRIRADIFEKMKEMKARTLDAGHALFFPL